MQVASPKDISQYIKHYLFLDFNSEKTKQLRLFANGNSGIVFTLNSNSFSEVGRNFTLAHSFLFGQISSAKDFILSDHISSVIVVLQPTGLSKLTGIPTHEVQNQFIPSELIFGSQVNLLNERLCSSLLVSEKVNHLNDFFRQRIRKLTTNYTSQISDIISYILSNKGLVPIEELCRLSNYHERKLQRDFASQVGLSPKKFSSIAKLHGFLGLVRLTNKKNNLTAIGLDAGYYDQAHLIREFKKITGLTPFTYTKQQSLAVNLIEIPN